MTYYRICGLSLLLTAIALSGCSSLAKKGEVITPLDNSTVNTPSSTDTSDSSASSYNIATLDPTPNTDYALGSSDAAGTSGKASKKKSVAQTASSSKSKRITKKYNLLSLPTQAIVYFSFDSDELSTEDINVLQAHLTFLQANPAIEVVLKGYSDERGTVNYNLALGEKRGNAVRAFFISNGLKASRFEVVSFGETKAIDEGHNEAAWAKNRRVEVVYQK
ncbi:MAG: OmpA family protein [Agitococcus sp.]|nr:OmpA family protein [Agitococcus sp.]